MASPTEVITSLLTAVVGVAIVGVIVSQKSATSSVISSFGTAFSQILSVAVSPVTGGSSISSGSAILSGLTNIGGSNILGGLGSSGSLGNSGTSGFGGIGNLASGLTSNDGASTVALGSLY
jgi:hypothetical protein